MSSQCLGFGLMLFRLEPDAKILDDVKRFPSNQHLQACKSSCLEQFGKGGEVNLTRTMSSVLQGLGIGANSASSPVPALAPYYLMFNIVLSYSVLTTRPLKQMAGIDNNVSPREDVTKYGETAVREGKLSRAQLERIKRLESCHANSVENLPILMSALLFATYAGVPNYSINRTALIYSCARVAYAISYVYTTKEALSYLRSILWWTGTGNCLALLWSAGKAMNA